MTISARSPGVVDLANRSPLLLTLAYSAGIVRALQTAWKAPSSRIADYPVLFMTEWK
jgi:hypothetical protein